MRERHVNASRSVSGDGVCIQCEDECEWGVCARWRVQECAGEKVSVKCKNVSVIGGSQCKCECRSVSANAE